MKALYTVSKVVREGTYAQGYEAVTSEPVAYDRAARLRKAIERSGGRALVVDIVTKKAVY